MPKARRRHGLTEKQEKMLLAAFVSDEEFFFALPSVGNRLVQLNYATNNSSMFRGKKYSFYKRYKLTAAGKLAAQLLQSIRS